MKTLIKIDRDSIKLNPEGGNTYTIINESKEVTISGTNKIPDILNEDNFILIEKTISSKGPSDWKGILLDHSLIDELQKIFFVYISVKYHMQKYEHKPLPKYLYKYENPQLDCDECGTKFLLNELEILEYDDGGYWDNCCPFCGEPSCVDIEYEKIENVKL